MAIVVNKPLPEFECKATSGLVFSNQSHLGSVLVLFFYPKDNTPNCTVEAQAFGHQHAAFVKAGVKVFGVSRDNLNSHNAFKASLGLPFELISDTEEKMCHLFGVVKNKLMYGKKVKGIERSTFLIGANGCLSQEWRGVKVDGHVEEVLVAVHQLNDAAKINTDAQKTVTVVTEEQVIHSKTDAPLHTEDVAEKNTPITVTPAKSKKPRVIKAKAVAPI